MTQKAVQLKVNGSKTYKVVDAHRDITKNMVEEYNPRFFQLYDEYEELIDLNVFPAGHTFTIDEIDIHDCTAVPCVWRQGTTDKRGVERRSSFTNGATEGQGSLKALNKEAPRLPGFLQQATKEWFVAAHTDQDLGYLSSALAGAIDSSKDLNDEDTYHRLVAQMFLYAENCKNGLRNLTDEDIKKLNEKLYSKVLQHTNIDRQLTI